MATVLNIIKGNPAKKGRWFAFFPLSFAADPLIYILNDTA